MGIIFQIMTWPSRPTGSGTQTLLRRRGVKNLSDSQIVLCCHRSTHKKNIYMTFCIRKLVVLPSYCPLEWLFQSLTLLFISSYLQVFNFGLLRLLYKLLFLCWYLSPISFPFFFLLSNHAVLKNSRATFSDLFCWAKQASFLAIYSFMTLEICFSVWSSLDIVSPFILAWVLFFFF